MIIVRGENRSVNLIVPLKINRQLVFDFLFI